MSAVILQFRKKPTPHPEYEAWAAARERARQEFEREQLRIPPREWNRQRMDLNVDWSHKLVIPIPVIVGVCCFAIGIAAGILIGITTSI